MKQQQSSIKSRPKMRNTVIHWGSNPLDQNPNEDKDDVSTQNRMANTSTVTSHINSNRVMMMNDGNKSSGWSSEVSSMKKDKRRPKASSSLESVGSSEIPNSRISKKNKKKKHHDVQRLQRLPMTKFSLWNSVKSTGFGYAEWNQKHTTNKHKKETIMDPIVFSKLERAVHLLATSSPSSTSSTSSNSVMSEEAASTMPSSASTSTSSGSVLSSFHDDSVLRAYSVLEGVCQTRVGREMLVAIMLNMTSSSSSSIGVGSATNFAGPSLNGLGAGLLHQDPRIQNRAYEVLELLDQGDICRIWVRRMNPFLLHSYNRRRKAKNSKMY